MVVDPNRVYLLGYSAGGDGVYQLAPRMGDRLAAASMMAGHPNDASPLGLRNLPFAIYMGGKDAAYKRNEVAAAWGAKLDKLASESDGGYPHLTTIYPEYGHWMNGDDKSALPWMASHTRVTWPKTLVWHQDDVTRTRFAWLAVDEGTAKRGTTTRATVDEQVITIETDHTDPITLRLRDELIDLDQPITVMVNGTKKFHGNVARSRGVMARSMHERFDPAAAATAELRLDFEKP